MRYATCTYTVDGYSKNSPSAPFPTQLLLVTSLPYSKFGEMVLAEWYMVSSL